MDAVSTTPSAHTIDPSFTDYKVADISLADYGRREITLAFPSINRDTSSSDRSSSMVLSGEDVT